ncbi:hypothetical protein DFS33DRAFT_1376774 [Desarmillaria ectypa]|nr:hypothetical protein DFS33DRAFT_1376774 [Desarmillaria ectypa]
MLWAAIWGGCSELSSMAGERRERRLERQYIGDYIAERILLHRLEYPANRQYLSDDEIVEVASKIGIADPNKDDGAFNTLNRMEALIWLKCMGVSGLSPPEARALSNEEVIENLRYALWSSQRIDNLFHGKTYLTSSKLDVIVFPAWPNWEKANTEFMSNIISSVKLNGFKDAKRMDSYVFCHFPTFAFMQMENMSEAAKKLLRTSQARRWVQRQ